MRWLVKIAGQEHRATGAKCRGHLTEKSRNAAASRCVCSGDCLSLGRNQAIADIIRLVGIGREMSIEYVCVLRRRYLQPNSLAENVRNGIAADDGGIAVEAVVVKAQ